MTKQLDLTDPIYADLLTDPIYLENYKAAGFGNLIPVGVAKVQKELHFQEKIKRLSPFYLERGLRQGDAMSPAIFVLCMEKLSQMITLRVNSGGWKGIQFTPDSPILSHLCFANDMAGKKVWNGEDHPRDDVFVSKAYKVWPSDEDRGTRWVAEPGIDSKATLFINGRTKFWSNQDGSN
nr:uncharacterized protein LOC109174175 [Ipomoea batatas]